MDLDHDDNNHYKNKTNKGQEEDRHISIAGLVADSTEIGDPREQYPPPPPHSHFTTTTQASNFFGAVGEKRQPPPDCRLPAPRVAHNHHHHYGRDDAQTERLEQAHREARYAIMRFLGRHVAQPVATVATDEFPAAVRSDAIGLSRKSRDSRLVRATTTTSAATTTTTTTVGDKDNDERRATRTGGDEKKGGVDVGVGTDTVTPRITTTTTTPTEQGQKSITSLSPTTRRRRILEFTEAVTRARVEMAKREKN
ncbi:hypothetical protein H2204_007041 [Knufia peltigerae]|uniref:Uncharacterized protein n=1 Tax=Knufia peltigerae TaxID=1002370 RepID=A0AA38Y3Q6_9EURO|nr:hypothetical protein H2204_007041 [Knufia peltigerae]